MSSILPHFVESTPVPRWARNPPIVAQAMDAGKCIVEYPLLLTVHSSKSGLIRLDFLVTRLHGVAAEIVWYITDLIGLGLGVVMIVAFNAQYRFVASRTYATMPNVHYTIQYIPMAIAGAFIALKSLEMLVGHIAAKKGGKAA